MTEPETVDTSKVDAIKMTADVRTKLMEISAYADEQGMHDATWPVVGRLLNGVSKLEKFIISGPPKRRGANGVDEEAYAEEAYTE